MAEAVHREGVGALVVANVPPLVLTDGHRLRVSGQPRSSRRRRAVGPLFDAGVKLSLLGYDELTTAAGRITDFMVNVGPAYEGSDRDWEQIAGAYEGLLGHFRTALDAVSRSWPAH